MPANKTVAVIGSLNIDFITRTARLPLPGETFAALGFDTGFGGKGANQAVAAARLAGEDVVVRMIGAVGDDSFGDDYLKALGAEGIDGSGVRKRAGAKTGVTNIIVEEATGENRILFVANANMEFAEDEDLVSTQDAEVVVFQLEIPVPTVLFNMRKSTEMRKHVVFNPAPAVKLPDEAYRFMHTLIMNETEAAILAGQAEINNKHALLQLAGEFLRKGVKDAVIITLGGEGLLYATASGESGHVPARKVEVVDTTAAGDTFVGGYAIMRARHSGPGFDYQSALNFANLAASKTVGKAGAMAAIPRLNELD
ncbi:uncharacterized protein MYCFIDRAFT_65226 [Pseudocercospora fijiensis CIRAD86]|uniref:Ribokinase n=1 Tax=Pseudocercospora fijiensis (strain CIRAD86) TaxID=383855 RepID=M3AYH8_PSEFD|nr:uncharacterized protein MYCFIDRAFT_65226 [Pseudocercospora fijiensis CIRAD86]EME82218.1 hypothetical protein MYCFIDRAFT_65226 [Pseudocercospora fijiensis CIRAD86]